MTYTTDHSDHTKTREAGLIARIDTRLRTWRTLWVMFLLVYFALGTAGVALSAIAATEIFEPKTRQILSLVSAVCVAVLGFLRPEARYRNLVRAWRELDFQKSRYLFGSAQTDSLLGALRRAEQLATEDEQQPPEPGAAFNSHDSSNGRAA